MQNKQIIYEYNHVVDKLSTNGSFKSEKFNDSEKNYHNLEIFALLIIRSLFFISIGSIYAYKRTNHYETSKSKQP